MAVKTLKLVPDIHGVLCPRLYTGNPLLIGDTGCVYYMTVHPNGAVRVHSTIEKPYNNLCDLQVRCPVCTSKMLPADSMFNNSSTQAFRCIICDR